MPTLLIAVEPLVWARSQMAFTLGAHIVLACLGVGLPALLAFAEFRHWRSGDEGWGRLAQRWAKAFAVLFAVGAVSGTVLSFELGLLWPAFMGTFGSVIGLPFTLEGFAFFVEAIFVGVYLYGGARLSPTGRLLSVVPIAVAGAVSAFFVVTANAWMNTPRGFTLGSDGRVHDVAPWAAMFNPSTPHETVHMIVAAYLVTGSLVAMVYAAAILRGRSGEHHRRGLALGLTLAAIAAPLQAVTGHWAGDRVAELQPLKLAAMEAHFETGTWAPLRLFGWPDVEAREVHGSIDIPGALSLLAHRDPAAVVLGLEEFPEDEWPPVPIVHVAFQVMVGIGTGLIALFGFGALGRWRRGNWPTERWYLRAVVAAGPASILALEAGWVVTEVGRQPWIVRGFMRTSDAVTDAAGLHWLFLATLLLYLALFVGAWSVLRYLASKPLDAAQDGPLAQESGDDA
ncbi:cytochrome ubiquinol oxidase subunit I [Engelhardtia mirabilis]|uniref:Cytochrome bd menaquinol oxidase subunit I n=1 Tax=Engelhardtia mirabilis TaxID=2528011 RepID=A0A518BGM0_9BACT|nr:Putative cytochrome bd menaquinol oxidase subunit I [Planctomycetes bacterium Pla133]QDV00437.1 Putative cytochrome bd menaquinol oxidase subunit I [Planctomycetes bacterium Pla86]